MEYKLKGESSSENQGKIEIRATSIGFGVSSNSDLASPAELLLSAFAACCLKNIDRFSNYMKFEYNNAYIMVSASRQDSPPMINKINYKLIINSENKKINIDLLKRNLEKFGTIYNTLNQVCEIEGEIILN